jgi:hypothetical protein
MGDVIGVTLPKGSYEPYSAQDTGLFLGKKHLNVPLTLATGTGNTGKYVFPSSINPPIMDTNLDGVIDEQDINVYINGVPATVTDFDPSTLTATISDTVAEEAVVTGDITEIYEFVSGQDWTLAAKKKTITWDEVRSNVEVTLYGASNDTLQVNMKQISPNFISLGYDMDPESDTYMEELGTPAQVCFAIVYFPRKPDEKYWGFFCNTCDLVFDTPSKGKAQDITDMTASLSLRTPQKLFQDLDEYPIDAGVPVV